MSIENEESTESGVHAAKRWRRMVAGESDPESGRDLDVVFVCTGNRFRSPLAAALLVAATAQLRVNVRSAGTLDAGSRRAFPETLEEAHRFGLDLTPHRAQPLAELDASQADVVIGFERIHVAVAVMDSLVPREHAFTLPELVELLELRDGTRAGGSAAEQARQAIAHAADVRSATRRQPGTPELADPVGGPRDVYAQTADAIRDLVARLAYELFG